MDEVNVLRQATQAAAAAQRQELRDLLRKTRDRAPSARLALVIAWAGGDLDQMTDLFPSTRQDGCTFNLDDCPYDWCSVHDY